MIPLSIQNFYHDPQGNALDGSGGIVLILIVVIAFAIWYSQTGGDMGVHEDTGSPIKSLNTREGKRAGQRRRYHENK